MSYDCDLNELPSKKENFNCIKLGYDNSHHVNNSVTQFRATPCTATSLIEYTTKLIHHLISVMILNSLNVNGKPLKV